MMFGGWTSYSTHYRGVSATFPSTVKEDNQKVLLGLSPMGDALSQGEDEHIDFIEFVLSVFRKDKSIVVALAKDKSNTNRAFALLYERVFVRCHSHRLAFGSEKRDSEASKS